MANSAGYNAHYADLDLIAGYDPPPLRDAAVTQWSAPRDLGSWVPDPTAGCAEIPDDNLRLCPVCGSEGVLIYARGNDPDHERYEECPECEGATEILVEVEPIEIEDLPPPQGETP